MITVLEEIAAVCIAYKGKKASEILAPLTTGPHAGMMIVVSEAHGSGIRCLGWAVL